MWAKANPLTVLYIILEGYGEPYAQDFSCPESYVPLRRADQSVRQRNGDKM